MQNTSSSKILKAGSIINVIGGIAGSLFGALVAAAGLFGADKLAESPEFMKALAQSGIPADKAGASLGVIGIAVLLAAIFTIVTGAMGVRAARDNRAIKPAWTLALISLVVSVAGAVACVFAGTYGMSVILSVALATIVFWAANDIKGGAAASARMA